MRAHDSVAAPPAAILPAAAPASHLTAEEVQAALFIHWTRGREGGGQRRAVHASDHRIRWLALLLQVVPRPSDPTITAAAAGPKPHRCTQPVRAMYEHEEAHAQESRTARRTLRDAAPLTARDAFNPSAYSMHPPPSTSAAASYPFSAPRVSSRPLYAEQLQRRASAESRALSEAEQSVGSRARRMRNIAALLNHANERAMEQPEDATQQKQPSDGIPPTRPLTGLATRQRQ